jgi:hypothetical protein
MVRILWLVYLIFLVILSIHTWIALRFHSFTVAVGVGMAAAIAWLPWALAVGILGGLALAVAGCWEVTRRDVL